jgi:REP element-mobilizing transposase RayT
MDKKYFSKFNQNSRRLKGHDYSSPGIYFITISTDAQIFFFGKIMNCKICLSPAGKIVLNKWIQIPKKFPNVTLDQFIIMPNHIHGIVVINGPKSKCQGKNTNIPPKLTIERNNIQKIGGVTGNKNPMISQDSLSYIIRWFKARSTYEIRNKFPKLSFAWQSRFHYRIIKDKNSLYAVRYYIRNNPKLSS